MKGDDSMLKNLDELLEEYLVDFAWENDEGPKNWYAVSNNDGIIAYFGNEKDAFAFRLMKINFILNTK